MQLFPSKVNNPPFIFEAFTAGPGEKSRVVYSFTSGQHSDTAATVITNYMVNGFITTVWTSWVLSGLFKKSIKPGCVSYLGSGSKNSLWESNYFRCSAFRAIYSQKMLDVRHSALFIVRNCSASENGTGYLARHWELSHHFLSTTTFNYTLSSSRRVTPAQQHTKSAREPSATRDRLLLVIFVCFLGKDSYFDYLI